MRFSDVYRIKAIEKEAGKYESVVLYGAGDFAGEIIEAFLRDKINIEFCVVTNAVSGNQYVKDIPVYSIKDRASVLKNGEALIIVAVNQVNEKQIVGTLKQYDISNYLLISDYTVSTYVFEQYKNRTKDDYLKAIAEYAASTAENPETIEIDKIISELKDCASRPKEQKHILFISDHLHPRPVKIALALKKNGYFISLILCCDPQSPHDLTDEMGKICDSLKICGCVEEVMLETIQINPFMIHFFITQESDMFPSIMINQKELFPKCVYDKYDIVNEMRVKNAWLRPECFALEKYCLEHATGICSRGYEIEYLCELPEYDIRGKTIRFPDYMDDIQEPYFAPDDAPLTVYHAGSFSTEKECPDSPLARHIEFAEMCAANKCHYHLYPVSYDEKRFSEIIEASRSNPYFHIHKPLPFRELLREINKYDYEVGPDKKEALELKIVNDSLMVNHLIYGHCNKYFDALSAGVPIASFFMLKELEEFEREGMAFKWGIEDFDFDELRRRRKEMKENVCRRRNRWLLDNHIQELIDFYNSL